MSYLAKEKFHLRSSSEMLLARVVSNLAFAFAAGLTSLYFNEVGFSNGQVGIVTGVASILVVAALPLSPIFLERHDQIKLYASIGFVLALIYGVSGFSVAVPWLAVSLFAASRIAIALLGSIGSVVFRDLQSSKKEFTKAQGFASSLLNLGWVIGPFLGGLVLAQYGIEIAFAICAAILAIGSFLLLIYPIKLKSKRRKKLDSSWKDNVAFYISKPGLRRAYTFRMTVTLWWSFVFTFIPLFMLNQGYSASSVGLFLTATQVPLFLFEFKTVGSIKRLGYKAVFMAMFGALVLAMLIAAISGNLFTTLVCIVVCSVAISFLEPITEIFLYDQVSKSEEEKAYSVFSTSSSVGSILGRLLIGFILTILGVRFAYLAMSVLLAYSVFIAWRMPTMRRRHASTVG